jgi:hypothetical protein
LIENNKHWQQLVERGFFDEEKAKLSLMINPQFISRLNPVGFPEVFKADTPTLATIKKYRGNEIQFTTVLVLVHELRDCFNFKNNLTDQQCFFIANTLIEDWHHLTLADIKLCFKNGVKGLYGPLFQNIDITTIYEWIGKYFEERTVFVHQKRQEEQKAIYDEEINERAAARFNRIRKSIESEKPQHKETKQSYKTIEGYFTSQGKDGKKEAEDLYKSWSLEFEQHSNKLNMPFELFCNYRISQFLNEVNK